MPKLDRRATDLATRRVIAAMEAGTPLPECIEAVAEDCDAPATAHQLRSLAATIRSGETGIIRDESAWGRWGTIVAAGLQAGTAPIQLAEAVAAERRIAHQKQRLTGLVSWSLFVWTIAVVAAWSIIGFTWSWRADFIREYEEIDRADVLRAGMIGDFVAIVVVGFGLLTLLAWIIWFFGRLYPLRSMERVRWATPIVGAIDNTLEASSLARCYESLLATGVPFSEACHLSKSALSTACFRRWLSRAIEHDAKGGALGASVMAIPLRVPSLYPMFRSELYNREPARAWKLAADLWEGFAEERLHVARLTLPMMTYLACVWLVVASTLPLLVLLAAQLKLFAVLGWSVPQSILPLYPVGIVFGLPSGIVAGTLCSIFWLWLPSANHFRLRRFLEKVFRIAVVLFTASIPLVMVPASLGLPSAFAVGTTVAMVGRYRMRSERATIRHVLNHARQFGLLNSQLARDLGLPRRDSLGVRLLQLAEAIERGENPDIAMRRLGLTLEGFSAVDESRGDKPVKDDSPADVSWVNVAYQYGLLLATTGTAGLILHQISIWDELVPSSLEDGPQFLYTRMQHPVWMLFGTMIGLACLPLLLTLLWYLPVITRWLPIFSWWCERDRAAILSRMAASIDQQITLQGDHWHPGRHQRRRCRRFKLLLEGGASVADSLWGSRLITASEVGWARTAEKQGRLSGVLSFLAQRVMRKAESRLANARMCLWFGITLLIGFVVAAFGVMVFGSVIEVFYVPASWK